MAALRHELVEWGCFGHATHSNGAYRSLGRSRLVEANISANDAQRQVLFFSFMLVSVVRGLPSLSCLVRGDWRASPTTYDLPPLASLVIALSAGLVFVSNSIARLGLSRRRTYSDWTT